MKSIRVAAIQMCSTHDRDKNLNRAMELMQESVKRNSQVIALPENFSFLGSEADKIKLVEDLDTGPSVQFLKEFASSYGVAIVGGTIPLKVEKQSKVTNTCLVFDKSGQLIAQYDKLHLFDVRLDKSHKFKESLYVEPGQDVVTVELFGHIAGLSVCYDLRFPELYRTLVLRGAEILFVPSAFTLLTGKYHWETLLRARAIENQCYVVAPAQFGRHNPQRLSYGRSMVVDPWGQILVQCPDEEGIIIWDLDFDLLKDVRMRLPCLEHINTRRFFIDECEKIKK